MKELTSKKISKFQIKSWLIYDQTLETPIVKNSYRCRKNTIFNSSTKKQLIIPHWKYILYWTRTLTTRYNVQVLKDKVHYTLYSSSLIIDGMKISHFEFSSWKVTQLLQFTSTYARLFKMCWNFLLILTILRYLIFMNIYWIFKITFFDILVIAAHIDDVSPRNQFLFPSIQHRLQYRVSSLYQRMRKRIWYFSMTWSKDGESLKTWIYAWSFFPSYHCLESWKWGGMRDAGEEMRKNLQCQWHGLVVLRNEDDGEEVDKQEMWWWKRVKWLTLRQFFP